jgi:hypothetical protein
MNFKLLKINFKKKRKKKEKEKRFKQVLSQALATNDKLVNLFFINVM